jgi:starvation-inducible DNA-binding protein
VGRAVEKNVGTVSGQRNIDIEGHYDIDGMARSENVLKTVKESMSASQQVKTGIEEAGRKAIAQALTDLFVETYTLYLETQIFHWNVTGPNFQSLHLMFERQYKDLAVAIDDLAERIRALGYPISSTFSDFSKPTSVKTGWEAASANVMIAALVDGNEAVTRSARKLCSIAEKFQDGVTVDLVTQRMQAHEKEAWMLRSHMI